MIYTKDMDLIEGLIKKKELLGAVLEIAIEQEQLLGTDDVEALLAAIDKRQEYLDEIEKLDSVLFKDMSRNDIKDEKANQILDEMAEIIQGILGLDSVNCVMAEKKLVEYRAQYRNIKQNKNRLNSYSNPVYSNDGMYIDAKK
jgi:hypothetical protein